MKIDPRRIILWLIAALALAGCGREPGPRFVPARGDAAPARADRPTGEGSGPLPKNIGMH